MTWYKSSWSFISGLDVTRMSLDYFLSVYKPFKAAVWNELNSDHTIAHNLIESCKQFILQMTSITFAPKFGDPETTVIDKETSKFYIHSYP